jgi:osmotically inducible protein OsmC
MRDRVQQSATIVWEGSVARGSGTITGASGALGPVEVDLPTRVGEAAGKSTPEELLAAAHVGCFTMSLGSILAREKTPPERLEVTATVTLEMSGERPQIPVVEIRATGSVPGADEASFREAVAEAEQQCLISRTLTSGAVEIRAEGTLA